MHDQGLEREKSRLPDSREAINKILGGTQLMSTPEWGHRYKLVTDRLSTVPAVLRVDDGSGTEAATLAHSLLDLDEICERVRNIMPRALAVNTGDEDLTGALLELGECFREFLYHVRDARFYRYLPGCEEGNTE